MHDNVKSTHAIRPWHVKKLNYNVYSVRAIATAHTVVTHYISARRTVIGPYYEQYLLALMIVQYIDRK